MFYIQKKRNITLVLIINCLQKIFEKEEIEYRGYQICKRREIEFLINRDKKQQPGGDRHIGLKMMVR